MNNDEIQQESSEPSDALFAEVSESRNEQKRFKKKEPKAAKTRTEALFAASAKAYH